MKKQKQGQLAAPLANRAKSGMPMAVLLNMGGAPRANAALAMVMFATAATPHGDSAGRQHAGDITKNLLDAAAAGGFKAAEEFQRLVDAGQLTPRLQDLAAEAVQSAGGADKFFKLLELATTPATMMGGA